MKPDLSRFEVKRPCPHCPFRDETRIRFTCRERAIEMEEQAYRQGFPCHETAECRDGGDGCPWPAIDNDEDLLTALAEDLGDWWNAPVFDGDDAFFDANDGEEENR